MNPMKPTSPNRSPVNLPTPKVQDKARSLGKLTLPTGKGPAKRTPCCGR